MDDLHSRIEQSILTKLVDTANTTKDEMFAELVMVAAQSIGKFNLRIMLFKKLKVLPGLVADLKPYTGISLEDIEHVAQLEPSMPSKPLEILSLDQALRHFFCPEHGKQQSPGMISGSNGPLSPERDIAIQSLEKTIYQQNCIISILNGRILKQTLEKRP